MYKYFKDSELSCKHTGENGMDVAEVHSLTPYKRQKEPTVPTKHNAKR